MPSVSASLTNNSLLAYLMVIFTTLCWGANTIFGQLAVNEVSPMAIVSLRWLGVVALLLVFAHRTVYRDWPNLRPHLLFFSLMGMLGYASFNGLFYVAAYTTTALNIGILQGAMPMFVLVGMFLVYRTPVTPLQILGVTIAFSGVAIVAIGGDFANLVKLSINFGDFLMIVACVLYSGYTIALRNRPQVTAIGMFTVMSGAAFLTSLPMIAVEASLGQFQMPTLQGWVVVALVTIFPSLLAQLSFMHAVKLIGPSRAGVMVNLAPVFAAIMAVGILNEPFQMFHGVALALVLCGILISERGKSAT